ncbi:CarD family transcriptional regulator [Paenibacillus sp. Marseille-Q4541]|uniref:CarD family transcriptional regulator n=1 Tax=Paenibacillus sp. Marseille-Q4541 TaxID=2831522 RepID=UPI001BA8CBEF|nr:CarD family transcriptional regulator [Paenibacillus sp. Marseille-Q4541]
MFQVGDYIFYPMYGAGYIEAMEEKEFLGEKKWYYQVTIKHPVMEVSFPIHNAEVLGIRNIADEEMLESARSVFREQCVDLPSNPTARQQGLLQKLKTGELCMEIQVIRDLTHLNTRKSLGWTDKNMLNNARKLVISELITARNISPEEASLLLDNNINAVS